MTLSSAYLKNMLFQIEKKYFSTLKEPLGMYLVYIDSETFRNIFPLLTGSFKSEPISVGLRNLVTLSTCLKALGM